jgi:hypothetical protein
MCAPNDEPEAKVKSGDAGSVDTPSLPSYSDGSGADSSGDADSDTTAETYREKERSQREARMTMVKLELDYVAQLRSTAEHYERLRRVARSAEEVIEAMEPGKTVVLYGSLALCQEDQYYLTSTSDADLAVKGAEDPQAIVDCLRRDHGWEVLNSCVLQRFGSTQYTLRHSDGELLDLTFVSTDEHFTLFEERQKEFRRLFASGRSRLMKTFGERGGQIFDAYVHLLKAFACWGTMSSFQAVCCGLFVLHYELNRWESLSTNGFHPKPESLRSLPLFERFLHFVATFFSASSSAMNHEAWKALKEKTKNQKYPPLELISGMGGCSAWVLDLSNVHWMPRTSRYWFAEMYFCNVEERFDVEQTKRMNVAHSVVPLAVSHSATWLMKKLIAAAPLYYANWTVDAEKLRWKVVVDVFSQPSGSRFPDMQPELKPDASAAATAATAPVAA